MSDKLEISMSIVDGDAKIEFSGKIDEDVDFSKIIGLDQKNYVFDFEKVEMINSCGIREWITYIEKLPKDAKLDYLNCPQIIIEQINLVHGFVREGAKINSFFAPYYCENCDEEEKLLLESSKVNNTKAPEMQCSKCNKVMEFDAIEKQYFNFLNQK